MICGEIMHCDCHDHAHGREHTTVGPSSRLVTVPRCHERAVIHESIHPVAILKVVVNEAVDYGYGRKFFA
jgi:hypothetical protein